MKKGIRIGYTLAWIAYLLVFLAKKNDIILPYFFRCYFADLLAIPLTLSVTTFIMRKYTANPDFCLSIPKIIVACLYFSILFEWILPHQSNAYTRDLIDVFCYFIGGGIYYYIQTYSPSNHLNNVEAIR